MPNLLEQLQSATSGSSLATDIGGPAGQLLSVAQLVGNLVQNPPGDFGSLLSQLQTLPLPQLQLNGDVGSGLDAVRPGIESGLTGLLQPLLGAIGGISEQVGGGDITERIAALLRALEHLQALFATDLTCGFVPALAPPAPNPPPIPPAPGDPPPPPPPPPASTPVLSTAQITRANELINTLPADLTVPSLLKWMQPRIGTFRPGYFSNLRSLPLLDDLRDPLETLVRWDGFTGAQLATELASTLDKIALVIASHSTGMISAAFNAPVIAALPAAAIGDASRDLITALTELDTAARANDAGTITTQLTLAQQRVADLAAASVLYDAQSDAAAALERTLADLPYELEIGICRLLVLLQPHATFADLRSRLPEVPQPFDDNTFASIAAQLDRVQQFLQNVLNLADVSAVTGPIAGALDQVAHTIAEVEQAIVQITGAARAQFEAASGALSLLDLDNLIAQADQALESAIAELQQQLTNALAPAANALSAAVSAIDGALDSFDPEVVAAPVQMALAAIRGVFEDPTVQEVIASLQQLKALAAQLDDLSFRPVTDQVVDGIGTVKSALDSIDDAQLIAPVPDMIRQAMQVLPPSIAPLTDPLLSGLDTLIDSGPIPLLQTLRDLPKPVLEELHKFSPRALLEPALAEPYEALRGELEGFSPTAWIDSAESELASLRERVARAIDLQVVLRPLTRAFQALADALDQFEPSSLLAPLTAAIESAIDALADVLPTTELTQALDQVFGQIQRVIGTLDSGLEVIDTLTSKLAGLADPTAQLDAWLSEILGKLDAAALASLGTGLNSVAAAVQASRAAGMQAAVQSARAPLAAAVSAASARARGAALVQAYTRLASSTAAMPASPAQVSLQTFLTSFDPGAPATSRGLRGMGRLEQALSSSETALQPLFADWDARYHPASGVLAGLDQTGASLAQLQAFLRDASVRQLGAPVISLLEQLRGLASLLSHFGSSLHELVQALKDKLNALLAAPLALAAAAQQLQSLITRLQNLDLDYFVREVDELYQQVVDQLRTLDPSRLEAPLRARLEQLLSTLSLRAVFTPALRAQLDATYAELLAKVDALDPELLVIGPLDALYSEQILPAADALDLSEAIDQVIARLEPLPDELRVELERVDEAYRQMLAAAPSGGGGGSAAIGTGG